jgi:hypothetical protein
MAEAQTDKFKWFKRVATRCEKTDSNRPNHQRSRIMPTTHHSAEHTQNTVAMAWRQS